jgi:hypothetical protein
MKAPSPTRETFTLRILPGCQLFREGCVISRSGKVWVFRDYKRRRDKRGKG